ELDQLMHQRQPNAGAFLGPSCRTLDSMKALEQPRYLTPRHTNAGIGNLQHGGRALPVQPDRNSSLQGKFEGIGEQVEDYLLPHLPINIQRFTKIATGDLEPQSRALHG